jgi:ketosteroid isomerase-like protein
LVFQRAAAARHRRSSCIRYVLPSDYHSHTEIAAALPANLYGKSNSSLNEGGAEMPKTASPTEVFHRLVDAIAERRQSETVDACYADDVVVEHPFMIPEPTTTRGREQLKERMRNLQHLPITMEIADVVVHKTADPEVIVGEFKSHITSKQTGKRITTSNILVLRVRNGLIVSSRDYHNHALLAAFIGLEPHEQ